MSLPSELILDSLQYLNHADLKNVRLVSKLWSGCAADYLFAKLFISPHSLNIHVFTSIAEHPSLSKCVKELEYDAIRFSLQLTILEYFESLWWQTQSLLSANESAFKSSDPEVNRYVSFLKGTFLADGFLKDSFRTDSFFPDSTNPWDSINPWYSPKIDVRAQCCSFAFVQQGYQKWMEQARFEEVCTESNLLLKVLVSGLKHLNGLKAVKLQGEWPSGDKRGREGSPLARSWPILYVRPQGRGYDSDQPLQSSSATTDFHDLTLALSLAERTGLRSLSIDSALPPTAFIIKQGEEEIHMDDALAVYSRLEDLKISLVRWCKPSNIEVEENLLGLQRMLESLTALKRFELHLLDDTEISDLHPYLAYPLVFPENGHWPQLTTLTLANLSIGTKDLITLLVMKMPSLSHLTFGNIRLLDGQWEGMIEYLRISNRLFSFNLFPEAQLLQYDDSDYLPLGSPAWADPYQQVRRLYPDNSRLVMDYVINWRKNPTSRHPSLKQTQPAHSSISYLQDVYRLCEVHDTGDVQERLHKIMLEEAAQYLILMADIWGFKKGVGDILRYNKDRTRPPAT